MVKNIHAPLGRRIAKKVGGTVTEKYLWQGRTRLLAVYNGTGALQQRFEYADGRLPLAMTVGGTRYFLVYDQVGSFPSGGGLMTMNKWITTGLIFLLTIIITNCTRSDVVIPQNWRHPSHLESNDAWRNENSSKYLITKGDFNGDGIVDVAMLLTSDNGSSLSLVAFISQNNKGFKTYFLNEIKDNRLIHAMGIKKVSPGAYATACGKGYWECRNDEVPEIQIQHDAIDYFKIESANSFFYWDAKTEAFKQIWISD